MRAVILVLCAGLACASEVITAPTPVEVISLGQKLARGDVSAIMGALSGSHQELSRLFGPHQLSISVQSKLSKDKDVVVNLQEELLLAVDASGAVHVQSANNQNVGFDAYLNKEVAGIANRYGPLQATTPEAVNRARDATLGAVYANLEPLSLWLVFVPGDEKVIQGQKGLSFSLKKKDAKAPEVTSFVAEKAWRATIVPELIDGELVLEPQSGFLLSADINLRYTATRNEQKILFEINMKAKLSAQGEAIAIMMPEVEPLEPKLRVEKERLDLIGKAALQQQKEKKKAPKVKAASQPTSSAVPKPTPAITPASAPK